MKFGRKEALAYLVIHVSTINNVSYRIIERQGFKKIKFGRKKALAYLVIHVSTINNV